VRAFVLSILTAFLFSCAAAPTQVHKHDAFTKHYEESLFQVTGKGMYSVEMVIKEHELKTGVNELERCSKRCGNSYALDAGHGSWRL
jgi:hypothetical protein